MKRTNLICILLAALMVLGLCACGGSTAESSAAPAASASSAQETPSAAAPAETSDADASAEAASSAETAAPAGGAFTPVTADLGDYHVEVVGAETFDDMNEKPALRIYYDFTNNSDEKITPNTLSFKAEQSGFELNTTSAWSADDVPEYGNGALNIYPGVTIRCVKEISYNPDNGGIVAYSFEEWLSGDTLSGEIDPAALPALPATAWEIQPIADPKATDGWSPEGDYRECHFKFLGAEIVPASSYEDCDQVVRVTFEFTNNSGEASSAWMKSFIYAFQDGIEMPECSAEDRTESDEMYTEDVAAGESATCSVCYGLRSDSPVEVTLEDSFDDVHIGFRYDG